MINFNFISKLEGRSLTGCVPDPENSKSGVTFAGGYDLGQRQVKDLAGLPDSLIKKFSPYLGLIKNDAVFILNKIPLTITEDECDIVNEFAHKESVEYLLTLWNRDSKIPFSSLSDECQTVVASVAFQYGNLSKWCPNFWRQVTTGDWCGALANLRNFGDKYPTRRNKEAGLLESRLKQYD